MCNAEEMTEAWTTEHLEWLNDTGQRLLTVDDKEIEIWELVHGQDEAVLSAWAAHFRNHYCLDAKIDSERNGTGLSRSDYLTDMIFPSIKQGLGPSVRAGDFGEILVADYLEGKLECWVPRFRWLNKNVPNESPKGIDVIGFKFDQGANNFSPKDTLIFFEVKAALASSGNSVGLLQQAINDSSKSKDFRRIGESLNFLKRKSRGDSKKKIARFQNPKDKSYYKTSGAAVIMSNNHCDYNDLRSSNCKDIPYNPPDENVKLLVIKGENMMNLVHHIYWRAADEA